MPRKLPSGSAQLRAFRSNIAALKKAGLTKAGLDARKVQPSRYYLGQIKKNLEIIQGKAKLVKTTKEFRAEVAPERQRSKGRVTVRTQKNERVYFNKKLNAVVSYTDKFGRRLRRLEFAKIDAQNLPKAPKGKTWYYVLPVGNGSYHRYTYNEIKKLVAEYASKKNASRWLNYLEVNEVVKGDEDDEDQEDDE